MPTPVKINEILDENLYGWKYSAHNCNRTAEAIRCYYSEWMTCYYLNGKQLSCNVTSPDVHHSIAKRRARMYVKYGQLPVNYTPLTSEQKEQNGRTTTSAVSREACARPINDSILDHIEHTNGDGDTSQ